MNPLKPLPTEPLAKRRRELNASVDRLVKEETNPCRRDWIRGSGIQPGPIATAVLLIGLIAITLINAELAGRCFDKPTNHQQLTNMESR